MTIGTKTPNFPNQESRGSVRQLVPHKETIGYLIILEMGTFKGIKNKLLLLWLNFTVLKKSFDWL